MIISLLFKKMNALSSESQLSCIRLREIKNTDKKFTKTAQRENFI